MDRASILHFSDTLCVWAYVGQIRIDELQRDFGDAIAFAFHYVPVFGNTSRRFVEQWADRGGIAGYAAHVVGVVEQFDHIDIHPRLWLERPPSSSIPSHLFLCAVRLLEAEQRAPAGSLQRAAWAVREGFFKELIDVSRRGELLAIAERLALPVGEVEARFDDGRAHAALSEDLDRARRLAITVSPTLIFNEGRQRLTGNVGYRVIEANVRELLRGPSGQHSWC